MHSYRRRHNHYPVVAFLDIKSAYDTVDRRIIWQSMLASSAPLSLVSLLANMFDDVSVSVLLQNNVSDPFVTSTGVLQGSVLSPHLYSIYSRWKNGPDVFKLFTNIAIALPNLNQIEQDKHYFEEKTLLYF
ncbi:hypothetical protein G6F37_013886 [Rhizopus arrhizus]|nr:hypothetical protein G6F37_013886 [Rhizopus arrhizus]